jgi:hypothetical protein
MVPIELHRGKRLARERGGGGDQFETQQLLLPIYKREGEPRSQTQVIGDKTLPSLRNLSKRQTEEGTPYT